MQTSDAGLYQGLCGYFSICWRQHFGVLPIAIGKLQNMDIYTMTDNKNLLLRNKATIVYSISLAFLLFLLKWLELRFIIFDHSFEIYIGFIAVIFTALGIWLALKLSRRDAFGTKPKIETVVVEKEVYVNRNENFVLDTSLVSQLELSKRELEILSLLAQGHSNQEIAAKLFVSLSTVKTHIQNLFEKLDVKRRTQALLKNQDEFNKHVMTAPDRQREFKGTDGTVGYIYAWSENRNAGVGEKEIKNIIEGKSIETEIRFVKPMAATASIIMETESLSDDQTKVY